MALKQTSVIIDGDKWDVLKARGYKLQDIVDNAFNNLLDINLADNLELNKEKNDLIDKKMYLIQDLERIEKEYITKSTEIKHKIKDVEFKINAIEETIKSNEKQAEEDKRLSEEKLAKLREHNIMFSSIYSRFIRYAESNSNRMDFFNNDPECKEYCKKYNMSLEDLSSKVYDKQLE